MIRGNKVFLRAVEEEDLSKLMTWRNMPEFKRNFREYRELNMSMQKNWFSKYVNGDSNTIMFSICKVETEEIIGCCGLCYINWIQRNADLSLYIGYENTYIDDEGFAKEACDLMFDYAFNELNLHKIWTELYEYDNKKIKFYVEELGFYRDGILREHHYMDGKWWNSYIYSLLKSEYKNV